MSTEPKKTPFELRSEAIRIRNGFYLGKATKEMNRAADAHIEPVSGTREEDAAKKSASPRDAASCARSERA
jgi:hypothetical protein